jgi:hypothetical protein
MNKHRLMRLHIPYNLIMSVFSGRIQLDDADLPKDAEVVQVHHDYERQSLCLFLQSEQFEVVEQGHTVPALPPLRVVVE